GKLRTSTSWAKKRKASTKAESRAPSRATNTARALRALTMSAITSASNPSGAPTRSRRPGSSVTRRICAAEGRFPSAISAARSVSFDSERLEFVHQRSVELGRRGGALQDPAIEVLVGLLQQALEPVELGLGESGDVLVRERPQNEV